MPKTTLNDKDPEDFLNTITDTRKKHDALQLLTLMKEVTQEVPRMWGDSIIGFGAYRYTYANGKTGDWPLAGFSPRKQNFSLYIMAGLEQYKDILSRLGKHKTSKACLYIKRLSDIDEAVLKELLVVSVEYMRSHYTIVTI